MPQKRSFTYNPPNLNSLRDNNNSLNTTGSHNHNSRSQNDNHRSFNRSYHISYTIANLVINNTPSAIPERSDAEILDRIPETFLPA